MAARGAALADAELYSICQTLSKKFEDVKIGRKATIGSELKQAVRLLLYGAKPDALHPSFKQAIFEFLCHTTVFSDVLATQSGVSSKNKILMGLLLKLLYLDVCTLPSEIKWKRLFSLIFSIFQRNLQDPLSTGAFLNNLVLQALDSQSGVPRQSILKIPQTLTKETPWKYEQAGEISKNLCQWLLVYTSQNPSSTGKKTLFQAKNSPLSPLTNTVMEIDGSPCRDVFTVLNMCKSYLKEHILNIYAFSVLKTWLQYVFTQGDINECLSSTFQKFPKGKDLTSQSNSPSLSSFGGSRFYDDLSSESDSLPSVSSSFASSPVYSQFDELSNDPFERRRTFDPVSSRPTTPAFSSRKPSQAFDTISITSDIFSNASNLKNVAAKYCLRIIVQSERSPQKGSDRGMITASVIEAIGILDILCEEESNFTQKVFVEIKKLYSRIEVKPAAARRVFVALVQFFIHHHQEMMVQIDEVLELYFKEIPAKCFTSQMAAFEAYELCFKNAEFFKKKTNILAKYASNMFKLVAWWPSNFLEEACDLMEIVVNEATAAEILHLILDLPCLSVSLQLKNSKILDDTEKLEATLGQSVRPYYKAMFTFVLREKSSGAETMDKMSELHEMLANFYDNPLVRYVNDIIPSLLVTYMKIVEDMDNEELYKKIFPILIERTFQLFPKNTDHGQIMEIFGNEIKSISECHPELIDIYSEEISSFLAQFQTVEETISPNFPTLVTSVLHSIGDSVVHVNFNTLDSLYSILETLVYEAGQNLVTRNSKHILANLQIVESLVSTIAKIAAHAQELIQRAVVCLNKFTSNIPIHEDMAFIQTYAKELMHTLNRPQVAPAILCGRNKVAPWHLGGDSSLMLKIHVLSELVD